jgi:hypothetical protein
MFHYYFQYTNSFHEIESFYLKLYMCTYEYTKQCLYLIVICFCLLRITKANYSYVLINTPSYASSNLEFLFQKFIPKN